MAGPGTITTTLLLSGAAAVEHRDRNYLVRVPALHGLFPR
jgi:hypothetical protein